MDRKTLTKFAYTAFYTNRKNCTKSQGKFHQKICLKGIESEEIC